MSTHTNNDFDDIQQLYTESVNPFAKKDKDEDEDEDEKVVKEEEEEEEDVVEEEEECCEDEDEETLEEGLFDRAKAKVGAVKDAATGAVKGAISGKNNGGITKRYNDGKTQRILQSHLSKIDASLSSLVTDVVKLGIMTADEAESFATNISNEVKMQMTDENKGRALSSQKRNFRNTPRGAKGHL